LDLFLIPVSAFAYWVPDSYGQEMGPRLSGPGGHPGGLAGLPWLGNILSGIFGNPGYSNTPVYGIHPAYYHLGPTPYTVPVK
jgi:hypothetical protein